MMKFNIALILACLPLLSQAQSTAITCWTDCGETFTLTAEESVVKLPRKAAAIDLRGAGAIALDRSEASPNCLFYTDCATAVEGLPGANVVSDGVCDGLLLTDDAGFYCPMAFTATDAMLRFAPRWDDEEEMPGFSQPCHETVVLPFDADMVIPFDADGPMPAGWLQAATYEGDDGSMLLFTQTGAEQLKAYTPYLVKFAYGAYGTQILFCGQDKTVEKTKTPFKGEGSYRFLGTTISVEEVPSCYRYHRGQEQYFICDGEDRLIEPFRCFILILDKDIGNGEKGEDGEDVSSPTGFNNILEYTVIVPENTTTDINTTRRGKEPERQQTCYDLKGIPFPNGKKGMCVTEGIKVIK